MSEDEKPTIEFLLPEFEADEQFGSTKLRAPNYASVQGVRDYLLGRREPLDLEEVQNNFNKRITEVLNLLSKSETIKNDFQIESISFSVGVSGEGHVSILGFAGASIGADAGFQVIMTRKK